MHVLVQSKKEFINRVSDCKEDVIQKFLDILNEQKIDYCIIGGLAVNAYVEPVISLDLDAVIAANKVRALEKTARKIFSIERFTHSINLSSNRSKLRIQIQIDKQYQPFITRAVRKDVMDYVMKVAVVEDVLQGKIWAYTDPGRRASQRQKDLADIYRLIECFPELKKHLPASLKNTIDTE